MKVEYQDSAIVKSLQNAGFSDEWIESQIESGDVKIEKSKTTAEMDRSEKFQERNIENDKKHIDDLKKDEKEDKKDKKDLERDKKEHEEKEHEMEKSFSNDLMKSIDSLPQALAAAITPFFKGINDRLNSQDELLKKVSSQAPEFKGANFNASVIEKSLAKDGNGKTELNIISQRPLVRKIVEKIVTRSDLEKSVQDQALEYLMNSDAITAGEDLAMYLYQKENISLVK